MGSELFVKPLEPLPKHHVFGLSGTYTARASSRKSLSFFFNLSFILFSSVFNSYHICTCAPASLARTAT